MLFDRISEHVRWLADRVRLGDPDTASGLVRTGRVRASDRWRALATGRRTVWIRRGGLAGSTGTGPPRRIRRGRTGRTAARVHAAVGATGDGTRGTAPAGGLPVGDEDLVRPVTRPPGVRHLGAPRRGPAGRRRTGTPRGRHLPRSARGRGTAGGPRNTGGFAGPADGAGRRTAGRHARDRTGGAGPAGATTPAATPAASPPRTAGDEPSDGAPDRWLAGVRAARLRARRGRGPVGRHRRCARGAGDTEPNVW